MMDWSASSIGIAGGGRVGQALGRLLHENNQPVVCVACRTPERSRAAATFIGPNVAAVTYAELSDRVGRVLVCVPDAALDMVADGLLLHSGVALHTCGALGPEALRAMAARGVSCGAIHPLQTIAEPAAGARALRSVAFAVSGEGPALAWAEQIVHIAHGRVLRIDESLRPLYHAAAVMASNYMTAVMAAAEEMMTAAGVSPSVARDALAPLASTSLENVFRMGPVAALTGPIERGDTATVAAHLHAIAGLSPAVNGLYRAAGMQALAVARRKGLAEERAADMERTLRERLV
jgi:predicted short-subunit dehydrogenase-like oxidoreductase (DUF2520 family)